MSTQRQIDANRKNAELSTGPKTEGGKANSRGNALKRGLSGEGVALHPAEAETLEGRLQAWRPSFQKELEGNDIDREFLFRQLVLNAIRMENSQASESEIHCGIQRNAILNWDSDQRLKASNLGERLHQKPGLTLAKLENFLQGREWLIAQWLTLKAHLETGQSLDKNQLSLMDDLLGIQPLFRGTETTIDNVEATSIVATALEGLQGESLENLRVLDHHDRIAAEKGHLREISREEKLNRRYEDLATKRFHAARNELKGMITKRKVQAEPKSIAPAPKPVSPIPAPKQPQPSAVSESGFGRIVKDVLTERKPSGQTFARNEPVGTLGKLSGQVMGFSVGVASGRGGSPR